MLKSKRKLNGSGENRPVKCSRTVDSLSKSDNGYEGMSTSELVMKDLLAACRSTFKPHDTAAVALLQKCEKIYAKASRSYVESEEFIKRAQEIVNQVRLHPGQVWVLTKDFFQEIKAYKNQNKPNDAGSTAVTETETEETANDEDEDTPQDNAESDSNGESKKPRKPSSRQIARLEELFALHCKEITKYDNMELSLDDLDDEDSSYLICERLKRRAAKLFVRLCELKNRSTEMGGAREKKFRYSGSRYKELNVRVQYFINKHDFEERMPDFSDIKSIVKKCNEKFQYRLNKNRVAEIAKEVFTEVGGMLSNIRKKDFGDDFGPAAAKTALTQESEDPATFSTALKDRLKANKIIADKNLKQEFQKWTEEDAKEMDKKAIKDALKKRAEVGPEGEAESEVDEEEDEEEDGDSDSSTADEVVAILEEVDEGAASEDAASKPGISGDADLTTKDEDAGDDESSAVSSNDSDEEALEEAISDMSDIDGDSGSESGSENGDTGNITPPIIISDSFTDNQLTDADIVPSSKDPGPEIIELDSDSD